MSIPALTVEKLTAKSFAPFGAVLDRESAAKSFPINEGTTTRHNNIARADCDDNVTISIFAATRRVMPLHVKIMERHPLGSQAFFPLTKHDWLVVVAEDSGGAPAEKSMRCFLARGDQGVQYARNIWHHPLLILCARQDFLVIDHDDGGSGNNLQLHHFATPPAQIVIAN